MSEVTDNSAFAQIHSTGSDRWTCSGAWTLSHLQKIDLKYFENKKGCLDAREITALDTAGALLIKKILKGSETLTLENLSSSHQVLFDLVSENILSAEKRPPNNKKNFFYQLGQASVARGIEAKKLLAFIGELSIAAFLTLGRKRRWPWKTFLSTIETTGVYAVPIVGLLSFLIGVVLTYQMGLQLRNYGAGIYIVDLLGLSELREFGPLIAAIIVAGRTSSSFTTELGAMKANEEIDALRTMGLSPNEFLVLPKVLGLLVSFPLLVVWADITGIFGGMLMANTLLDISYSDFISRFSQQHQLHTFMMGMIKTPAFALVIAIVGCFQGFRVKSDAISLGRQTTKSVVQAIFLIIIIDALYSVVMGWGGF